ncbi:MAG: immunoglobulin domain-containing protein [Phycisphaerae bacterium]|nr:immunoglobulin domain-containing protein [Phycisphaerae bacterium]
MRLVRDLIGVSLLMVHACGLSASAQCPPGTMTSLFWMQSITTRQSGLAVDMTRLPTGELLVLSGDVFFGPGAFQFVGAGFVFRGTPDGVGGYTWTEEAMIRSADAAMLDQAGNAVAIIAPDNGDTLAMVGASLDDLVGVGADAGSASTFRRGLAGAWTQEAMLVAPDAAAGDSFGKSVSIAPDAAIVGSPNDDDGAANAGSAYVFARVPAGMAHQWSMQTKLTAFDPSAGAKFGSAVVLLDGWACVGAPYDDQAAGDAGAVYVFRRTSDGMGGDTWLFHSKIIAMDAQAGDQFGASLSADAGLLLVGAPFGGAGDTGAASVYRLADDGMNGDEWLFEARLTPLMGQASAGDQVGCSVSLRDGLALLGAYQDDTGGTNTGSAYLFRRTVSAGEPVWTVTSKIRLPTPAPTDDFGFAVAMASGWAAIGSPAHNQYGTDRGNTFVLAAPAPPVLLRPAADQSIQAGDTLVLSVEIGGQSPWTYQWFRGNVALTDGGRISGADASTLTITDAQVSDAGAYRVEIANSCGVSASHAAVSVAPSPCAGDANGDRVVNFADVTAALANFGFDYRPGTGPGDANADGVVNFADITSVLSAWGAPCP